MTDAERAQLNFECAEMLRRLADQLEKGELHLEESHWEAEVSDVTEPLIDPWRRFATSGRSWLKLTLMNPKMHQEFLRAEAENAPCSWPPGKESGAK